MMKMNKIRKTTKLLKSGQKWQGFENRSFCDEWKVNYLLQVKIILLEYDIVKLGYEWQVDSLYQKSV